MRDFTNMIILYYIIYDYSMRRAQYLAIVSGVVRNSTQWIPMERATGLLGEAPYPAIFEKQSLKAKADARAYIGPLGSAHCCV